MTFTFFNRTSFWAVFSLRLFTVVANAEHDETGETGEAKTLDIVDTAVDAGKFSTLAAALTAANLVDTLKGDGPFSVFAPTDAAFAKLPGATTVNGSDVTIAVVDGGV